MTNALTPLGFQKSLPLTSVSRARQSAAIAPRFGEDGEPHPGNHPVVKLGVFVAIAVGLSLVMKAMTGSYIGIEIPNPADQFKAPPESPPALKAPLIPEKQAPPKAKAVEKVEKNDAPPRVILGPNILPLEDDK